MRVLILSWEPQLLRHRAVRSPGDLGGRRRTVRSARRITGRRRHYETAGYDIGDFTQVGRKYNMPGGGTELQFKKAIPPQFVKVVRP